MILQQNQAARAHIFGVAEIMTQKPKHSTLRLRRLYNSAGLASRRSHDIRPYADVIALGERISVLVDSGVTVSLEIH